MELRRIDQVMGRLEPYLDLLDSVLRSGHQTYQSYESDVLLELDGRAQAACTYCHIVAAAEREFDLVDAFRPHVLRGDLKVWHIEEANAVIRFKKTDEDGRSRNYPTKQARDYDLGRQLEGLPPKPTRLTVGYLLDDAADSYIRTQVSLPRGRGRIAWCAAIVPGDERQKGERIWIDVTRQQSFA